MQLNFATPDQNKPVDKMSNLSNSVRLTGYLGGAPEIKTTSKNKKVARITIATNGYHRNTKNELVKDTQWHQLILWEKQADIAEKYLHKGSGITIEGRLANRAYTDKAGIKRFVTEVVVNELMMLDKREN